MTTVVKRTLVHLTEKLFEVIAHPSSAHNILAAKKKEMIPKVDYFGTKY